MNVAFWKKHQNTSLDEAKELLQKSHGEVMRLAESFSNEELFSKGGLSMGRRKHAGLLFCQQYSKPLRLGDKEAEGTQKKLCRYMKRETRPVTEKETGPDRKRRFLPKRCSRPDPVFPVCTGRRPALPLQRLICLLNHFGKHRPRNASVPEA